MRSKRSQLLSLVLLLALAAAAYGQAPAPSSAPKHESVAFASKLIGATLAYNVVLPADYAQPAAKQTRYPVLFLLHGLGGSAGDWVSARSHLVEYAAEYRFVNVVPEGRDGWYTDSATFATDKYETYFVEELLPDVERRFRTLAAREGRGVAGLSMGGYGALKFGLKHPDKFALAASMSGALAAPSWLSTDRIPQFVRPSVLRVFGPDDSPVRGANDIYKIVRELSPERVARLPYLYLDCGTEDFLINYNREFATLLFERKVPHEFRQLPGTHNWPYWDRQVREVLKLASQKLAAPAAAAANAR